MDEIDASCDCGGKADAVVRTEDVVIHRLGNGQYRKSFLMEPFAVAQGVVAADRDEDVDAQALEVLEYMGGEVGNFPFLCLGFEEVGDILVLHLARVGPGSVKVGAPQRSMVRTLAVSSSSMFCWRLAARPG